MPTDIYIYLKGGRGDGFVTGWNGTAPSEENTTENGEPYRNIIPGVSNPELGTLGFQGGPGFVNVPTLTVSGGGTPVSSVSLVKDDALTEMSGTPTPPRAWTRTVTWLIFTGTAGPFKFRKDLVIGWGTAART